MNYIEHQIANIDTKTQRLQKIAALHSDEQEIIDDCLIECSESDDISNQNVVNGIKGYYLEYFVNYKIHSLLLTIYEYSPNIEFIDSYHKIASKFGVICKTEDVFSTLKTFSGNFAEFILLKYGNVKLSKLFESNDEVAFLSELEQIEYFDISLICGLKATIEEFNRLNYREFDKNGINLSEYKSIINTIILKVGGSLIVNTLDLDQLKKGIEIMSFDIVSKDLISTFCVIFDVFHILNDKEKKILKTVCEKSFYQDDLWNIFFQAYGDKYGQNKLAKLLNYYEEKDPDLADYINAYNDSHVANKQSEATTTKCEEVECTLDNECNNDYPFVLKKRRRLRNKTLIDEVCKKFLSKWFKNGINDVPFIKFIFFEYGTRPTEKLIFIGDIKDLVSFLLFLNNGSGTKKIWDYINEFIVDEKGQPVLKSNPRSNVTSNLNDPIGEMLHNMRQKINRKLKEEEEEDLK